ncbi:hypothetical protein [Methylomonas rosea]|uniref:Uncharacterized protein n=1 Tax=Methylomonas rosea TaxID=2952227 RepID=A0ABT1TMV2_9GAMM|nr:hypothetical protein [Methylomonas sp. WSC-7]MCQ8116105.1 hypothetical protein [Methylomonas sp. WSC-7]
MPKVYVRVNLRTDLEKRDRCAERFTRDWKEIDIDDATRAALEEDPYLEVSDTPTVLVEVAATVQAAVETAGDLTIHPESEATGETAAEGTETGTASPVPNADATNNEGDHVIDTVTDGRVGDVAVAAENNTTATDGADLSTDQAGTAESGTELSAAEAAQTVTADTRMETIKAAIGQLDPNNSEQWLSDGKPVIDAITVLTGFRVMAVERDQAWSQIKTQAAAE